MRSIDTMFGLAIELRDKGQLRDSVKVLSEILDGYPLDKDARGIYAVLGGIYMDLGDLDKALLDFKKATELNPESELASLGLYVTLAKLDRDEEAVHELTRFLKKHPADLYKDTLGELLEGLEEGYMINFEGDIRHFARANGVER